MIRGVHPGSRGQKATGSRIRIRNTVYPDQDTDSVNMDPVFVMNPDADPGF
jgi:hypothetical protein